MRVVHSSDWAVGPVMTEDAFHNGWNALAPNNLELIVDEAPDTFARGLSLPYDRDQHIEFCNGVTLRADPSSNGLILLDLYKTKHYPYGGITRLSGGVIDPNGAANFTGIRFANSAAHGWEHGRILPGATVGVSIQVVDDGTSYKFAELVRLDDVYITLPRTGISFWSTIPNADMAGSRFRDVTIDSPTDGAGGAGPFYGVVAPPNLNLRMSNWDIRMFIGSYVDSQLAFQNQDNVKGVYLAADMLASKLDFKIDSYFKGTPNNVAGLEIAPGFTLGGNFPMRWFAQGQFSTNWPDGRGNTWGGVHNPGNLDLPINDYARA